MNTMTDERTQDTDSRARGSVLIVDDDPDVCGVLSDLLNEEGFETRSASNGLEALTQYQTIHPDAVLLDVFMPMFDGVKTLKALKNIDASARVAMVTASCKREVIREAIQAGAVDFILKPFDLKQVMEKVEDLVA